MSSMALPLPRRRRLPLVGERPLIGFISVALGLLVWDLITRYRFVSPILLSSPEATLAAFVQLVASGELQEHLLVSAREFVVGFLLSVVVGLPVAVAAGWYKRFGWFIQPVIAALYAAPTVALFPLIVIFLGIGFWDKVLIVFISGFLQIFIAVSGGIRATDHNWVRLARSFRASQTRLFWSIILPGALPYILLGLRLAVGRCIVNVVVAEMLAAEAGVGYMIAYYGNTFKVANVFCALVAVVVLGVILNQGLLMAERHFSRWRPSVN